MSIARVAASHSLANANRLCIDDPGQQSESSRIGNKHDDLRAMSRPQLLCAMRLPPDPNGHGGSQRAMRLLEALRPHGDIHFVLLFRQQDTDCVNATLEATRGIVRSVTSLNVRGWQAQQSRRFGIIPGKLWDLFKMGSQDAPRLNRAELKAIASRLPLRHFDLIFAGRLSTAYIVNGMLELDLIRGTRKVVDFDDIMSKFRARQVEDDRSISAGRRIAYRVDAAVIARAESKIAESWDAVSVCSDEDVVELRGAHPGTLVVKLPNVVDRMLLPPRVADGSFRILFTGNLGFSPNIEGLRSFIEQARPHLLQHLPHVHISVVGINPTSEVRELCNRAQVSLHANVPSLEPYYAGCDAVIAPILFGSGTRVKILEAMAYGRPVVSTTIGAEGLALRDGKHVLLADSMDSFADALIKLAKDETMGRTLALQARSFQEEFYTPRSIASAMVAMVGTAAANCNAGF